jgi:hypothetical protein
MPRGAVARGAFHHTERRLNGDFYDDSEVDPHELPISRRVDAQAMAGRAVDSRTTSSGWKTTC